MDFLVELFFSDLASKVVIVCFFKFLCIRVVYRSICIPGIVFEILMSVVVLDLPSDSHSADSLVYLLEYVSD